MGNVNCVNCCEPLRHEVVKAKGGSRSPRILRNIPPTSPSSLDSPASTGRNPSSRHDNIESRLFQSLDPKTQRLNARKSFESYRTGNEMNETQLLTPGRSLSHTNPNEIARHSSEDNSAMMRNPFPAPEKVAGKQEFDKHRIGKDQIHRSSSDSSIESSRNSVDSRSGMHSSRERMVRFVVMEAKVTQAEAIQALEQNNFNAVEAVLALS